MPDNLKGILLGFLSFAAFAMADIAGKYVSPYMTPWEMSFWYSLPAIFVFVILAPWLGGLKATFQTNKRHWHIIRSLLTALIPPLNFYALTNMPLVNFYTLIFTAPFITVLISIPFLGQRVKFKHWLVVLLGFAGVAIAMRPDLGGFGWPELAVLFSAFTFGARNLIVPKMGKDETFLSYGLFPYIAIILLSGIFVIPDFELPRGDFGIIIILGGLAGGIGTIAGAVAFRIASSSVVAPTHYSQIIWGLVFGILIFGDWPLFYELIGAGIVCCAGIALVIMERKDTSRPAIITHAKNPPLPPGG